MDRIKGNITRAKSTVVGLAVIAATSVFFLAIQHTSLEGELNNDDSFLQEKRQLRLDPERRLETGKDGGYLMSNKIFAHVHMAKTGGTTLNGLLANKFERVCGYKGYSYDAYLDNERDKQITLKTGTTAVDWRTGRTTTRTATMDNIGYEDCDYLSFEMPWDNWDKKFKDGKLHGVPIEMHVPCRDPIDHLMSQMNYQTHKKFLDCDATSEEDLINSITKGLVFMDRFGMKLLEQFDVKCFDFKDQFGAYIEAMSHHLQKRRFESGPYIQRETNRHRDKDSECVWENPDVKKRVNDYLVNNVDYYKFCNECIGSENQIKLDGKDGAGTEEEDPKGKEEDVKAEVKDVKAARRKMRRARNSSM